MLCEHYKDALIEAAATGSEPQGELQAHLASCSSCRAALTQEQTLFAAIDVSLYASANAEAPASLLPRVRASLDEIVASPRSWTTSWFALAGATAAIAALFAASVLRHPNSGRNPEVPIANTSSAQRTMQAPSNVLSSARPKPEAASLQPPPAPKNVPQKTSASRTSRLEVLVPGDQELLVASYAQQWSTRRRAPLLAGDANQATVTPLEVLPIQIAELDVKLLTGDGSK